MSQPSSTASSTSAAPADAPTASVARLAAAVRRRRTFAIISHPDAGKTTLTEKLLLFGGAIQLAGAVKARGEARRAHSDWMKVERERGISVTSSVMTFDYSGRTFNLLDTPGHEDFSEDTYRTLTAVDSAVMVLDSAKGIENQTRKLFEVCRLRDMPITTFVNKMDREGRDPFEILDEIANDLQLDTTPMSWPVGMGQRFAGCFDLVRDRLVLLDRSSRNVASDGKVIVGLESEEIDEAIGRRAADELREGVAMVRGLCPPFDTNSYHEGNLTPVHFGSALINYGVQALLDGLGEHAPSPRPQPTANGFIEPTSPETCGFVFKIQANMDPKHRDRVAFVRLCSGRFHRGIRMHHPRSGKAMNIHNPLLFLARDREVAEEAWPGDIIGIPNHGNLRIGDALTSGDDIAFLGIPSFAPEFLRRVRTEDPMKAKHLSRALLQLAEEGAAQILRTRLGSDWIVGVAGPLQFEVLADRIRTEYDIPVRFETTQVRVARWVTGDPKRIKEFVRANEAKVAEDHDGAPAFLAANEYWLGKAEEDWPDLGFNKTREQQS